MSEAGEEQSWLGMYRPETSEDPNEIRYNSNGNLIEYSAWRSGQPNNLRKQENCVVAMSTEDVQNWWDGNCFRSHPFVCEI